MAENVKRRMAAARLAVAFVAAGTIAGATAWASPGAPPPTAQTSGEHFKKAVLTVRSSDQVVDGSLLYKDFKKNEVPSFKQFAKVRFDFRAFKKATVNDLSTVKGELSEVKGEIDGIKGELGSYVKLGDADARYMKIDASVIDGDGSVLTSSKPVGSQSFTRLADAAGMFTVDAQGPTTRITNTGNVPIQHSSCPAAQGGTTPPGELAPGAHIDCFGDGSVMPVQLIGAAGPGGGPWAATLNVSSFSWGVSNTQQSTVQILIGLL